MVIWLVVKVTVVTMAIQWCPQCPTVPRPAPTDAESPECPVPRACACQRGLGSAPAHLRHTPTQVQRYPQARLTTPGPESKVRVRKSEWHDNVLSDDTGVYIYSQLRAGEYKWCDYVVDSDTREEARAGKYKWHDYVLDDHVGIYIETQLNTGTHEWHNYVLDSDTEVYIKSQDREI